MAGRKKSEYNDDFQPHIRINEDDRKVFNSTVKFKTQERIKRKLKGLNRSKIFRDLIIKFNNNPQEVLDFINYDND